ncbi:MAG: leucine-rich repeat protein [Clostridiales bacterium]|nr:leucine-rich repeat protein [Clostridiales bacterium]
MKKILALVVTVLTIAAVMLPCASVVAASPMENTETNVGIESYLKEGYKTKNPAFTYQGLQYQFYDEGVAIVGYSTNPSGKLVIPAEVKGYPVVVIAADAFFDCNSITEVSLPNSLWGIGEYAFASCSSLKKVSMPGVIEIYGYAFADCANLTDVIMPKIVLIHYAAFALCYDLKNVFMLNVKYIDAAAFYGCTALKSVSFLKVLEIWDCAFYGCSSLKSAYFYGNAPYNFRSEVFKNCKDGFKIYFAKGTSGWKTPKWNGYRTERFTPSPLATYISVSTVASTGKNKLTWEATNGEKYYVYVSTGSGYEYLGSTKNTSYTHKSAVTGTKYSYTVKTVIGSKKSGYSNSVASTCDLPRPVISSLENVASSGKIKISWAKISGAIEYKVYCSTTSNGTYNYIGSTTSSNFTDNNGEAGITYYYKVKAIHSNSLANSAPSTAKYRMVDLERPVISLINDAETGKIQISWNEISGARSYWVYRSDTKNGTYSSVGYTFTTSFLDTSGVAGETYYYKVIATHEKSAARSALSTSKYRTVDLSSPVITVELQNNKPYISWEQIDGAIRYDIYRAPAGGYYELYASTTDCYYTDNNADSGTTYFYRLKAIHTKSAANSAYGKAVCISVQ